MRSGPRDPASVPLHRIGRADGLAPFARAVQEAEALVERATGAYELSETRMGFVAVINDRTTPSVAPRSHRVRNR